MKHFCIIVGGLNGAGQEYFIVEVTKKLIAHGIAHFCTYNGTLAYATATVLNVAAVTNNNNSVHFICLEEFASLNTVSRFYEAVKRGNPDIEIITYLTGPYKEKASKNLDLKVKNYFLTLPDAKRLKTRNDRYPGWTSILGYLVKRKNTFTLPIYEEIN